ncbi:MAG TPA: serine hydrolase domain-containing protein [Solirubrobacteraceae bacterium]|nr:serine hydrolase domain-containing protein [Solirubrobacteraceae bacterium]
MSRVGVLVLVVLVVLAGCGGDDVRDRRAEPAAKRLARALQAKLDTKREEYDVRGITASVVFPDGSRWSGASGLADTDPRRPMRPDTPMPIASVTKPLTAALAVALAREGRLSLDDRLSRWVPRFPNARNITLRQLLNHTSGLFNVDEDDAYAEAVTGHPSRAWTPAMVLRYVRKPYGPPGSVWHYSDTNYTLMGLVLQRASGTSVAESLHRLVLDQHGMRDAALQPEEPAPPATARGYDAVGPQPPPPGRYVPFRSAASSEWTAAGVVATAPAVATWGRALFAGRVVDRRGLREILRFVPTGDDSFYATYGLGVAQRHIVERDVVGASGRFWGFSSELWHDPATRATVAVLWNDTVLLRSPDVADTLLEVVRLGR